MILRNIKGQQGFSLLELLIYMAILSGFLLVIVNIFFTISGNSSRAGVRSEVQDNLRFAAQQISIEARKASAISFVSPSGDTLRLTVDGKTTEFKVVSGVLKKTTDAGGPTESTGDVTADKVTVSVIDPIFVQLGNTIQINLKIDYNDNGRADYKFSDKIQTSVSLRNQ